MSIAPGARLGPYEILASLGAGGMGEVYKARDLRLDRVVALKILSEALAADPHFQERFDREARAVSHLEHPHICTLYDVGQFNGTSYLVMQYLEGHTLAETLRTGPLPVDLALRTAIEIAGALEAAHRAGIVHRDLKPGNIVMTKSGAKLLDFGLAKAVPSTASGSTSMLQTSPAPMTAQGTILGTFQYMAPEQIEGEEADARTDIFAFGAVLFEMLTGQPAFAGKTQASLVGSILKDEPPPVSRIKAAAPPAVDYVVRTCLAKDPDARFQSAHDLGLQLRWITEGGSAAGIPAPVASRRRSRERLAWAAAAVLAVISLGAGALALVHLREQAPVGEPVQFGVLPEPESSLRVPSDFAVSPDGRHLVFVAASTSAASPLRGVSTLWIRSLATLTARVLPGTQNAYLPFWSPDGRQIGFFAGGKLLKVDVAGGPPVALCDLGGAPIGASWSRDNVIVFGGSGVQSLSKVDAAGGIPVPATTTPGKPGEVHVWPSFLPDGRHILYLAVEGASRELRVGSLDSAETTSLGTTDSNAIYTSNQLIFVRGGTLMTRGFDAATLRLVGEPVPVAEQVSVFGLRAAMSASASGVLAYWRGGGQISRLAWMDRTGKVTGTIGEPAGYINFSLSPDERRVAVAISAAQQNRDIWIIDLARNDTASRLTFDPAREADPAWSPDGSQVVFNSDRTGLWNLGFRRAVDASGDDVPVLTMERLFDSPDWSHDGRFIVFTGGTRQDTNDLWIVPTSGNDRKPQPFLKTPFREDSPAFSPDDRWVAYNSDASGRFEVYVRSFPGPGGQFQISRDGGWAPKWRADGKELFFLALDGTMMAVDVTMGATLQAGVPRPLFATPLLKGTDRHVYAVTRDGKRFLLRMPDERQVSVPITVVLNWPETLKK